MPDRDQLRAAVDGADLRALLMVVFQLSGNRAAVPARLKDIPVLGTVYEGRWFPSAR